MRKINKLIYLILLLCYNGYSANVTIGWNAPDSNNYIYNVYFGTNLIVQTENTSITLTNSVFCRTNCYVTAQDSLNRESLPSNILIMGVLTTLSSTDLNSTNWGVFANVVVDETVPIQFFKQQLN